MISLSSVRIISKSLNGKDVQIGLDRAHVFHSCSLICLETKELFSCAYCRSIFSASLRASKADVFFCQIDSGGVEHSDQV